MTKILYMGLEPYESRYTLQLTDWTVRLIKRYNCQENNPKKVDLRIVPGNKIEDSGKINTGQVLDCYNRTYFSLTQTANLVELLKTGEFSQDDAILYEDLFTPGVESLPYIFAQITREKRPRVFFKCLAQTIDPDDFVHYTGMYNWMKHYESLVNEFATGILATNEEMVAHMRIAGWKAPIYCIGGLTFCKEEVQSRVPSVIPFYEKKKRVAFASRFHPEKQPDFLLDVVERFQSYSDAKFVILSGSNVYNQISKEMGRARLLCLDGKLEIHSNLTKDRYYKELNDSKVLINTALQDWTSNTASEADALGCNLVFPAYRSFPEVFDNDRNRLYVPWSVEDCCSKLFEALILPQSRQGQISDHNDQTVDRILDIIVNDNAYYDRNDLNYRRHLR